MEKLFFNGDILTMEEETNAEAVYIKDGRIEAVGSKEDILALRTAKTETVDLQGRTLMPAFIDSHSHISALAQTVATVPLRDCTSIGEIIAKLREYRDSHHIPEGRWIVGHGYDHNFLTEKRHPHRNDLDQVSVTHPILVSHISGHMGVVNTCGMEELGLYDKTANPAGGRDGGAAGAAEPDGYLEEGAFINLTGVAMQPDMEELAENVQAAQEIYLENGITTVQDGLTRKKDMEVLKYVADRKSLKVDVVAYADASEEGLIEVNEEYDGIYRNHLKIGGYKLILDGSPQSKTAWMTEPYEGEETYRGSSAHSDDYVEQIVEKAIREGRQLLTHCNGDAAADQLINAFMKAEGKQESEAKAGKRIRPVMIHAQTVRRDQLRKMKQLGIIPSFFVAHVYYWGDVHIRNLGERAFHISPAASAAEEGLLFTFHQDTPVIAPNMLETVWCAVNRVTQKGIRMEGEEISVYDALKAVTINGAYQYFEEKEKGSIAKGKRADLIILDQNPLTVDKSRIKDIQVLETIKDGETVWKAREQ